MIRHQVSDFIRYDLPVGIVMFILVFLMVFGIAHLASGAEPQFVVTPNGLFDVRPSTSLDNRTNARLADPELVGKGLQRLPIGTTTANLSNRIGSEFSAGSFLAPSIGPMSVLVIIIACTSIPAEIAKFVVHTIAVVVATLHPIRARTDKSQQDETMNSKRTMPSAWIDKNDKQIPFSMKSRLQFSPREGWLMVGCKLAPHASIITNTVIGETGNLLVCNSRICHSHDVTSCKRGCRLARPGGR